jgi:hypothetical protein
LRNPSAAQQADLARSMRAASLSFHGRSRAVQDAVHDEVA